MTNVIVVRAAWDQDAQVWVAQSSDLPGLVTEASSLDELGEKLPGLIQDLLDDNDNAEVEIPVEVIATFSQRVRARARAA
jgi:hypothetical protein